MGWLSGRVLDRDDALVRRLVGQGRSGHHVAYGPYPGPRGAHGAVDADQPRVIELDPGAVEAQALDVGAAARGQDQIVELALLITEGERDAFLRHLDIRDQRAGVGVYALTGEAAGREAGEVRVLGGEHSGQGLRELNLGAPAGGGKRRL